MKRSPSRRPIVHGIVATLGLLASSCRPAGAVAGATPPEISRDLWYLVPGVDRLTAVWLGPEVRGPAGPPFRFLNVVHNGPDEVFAAFSRPVVDPHCGAIELTHRDLSIVVAATTGDWRTVRTREDLEVTVTLP